MLSFVWVLKGIRVFNLEQDSTMKRDFCLKQSQVLKASTEHFYPDFSRDPRGGGGGGGGGGGA